MRYSLLSVLPALAAASPSFAIETIHKDAAPVLSSTHAKEVPNSYMVVFKKHVKDTHAKKHHDWVQSVHSQNQERMELKKRSDMPVPAAMFNGLKHTYNMAGMMGYSGHFDDDTIEVIRRHPDVSCCAFCFTPKTRCTASLSTPLSAMAISADFYSPWWRLGQPRRRGWALSPQHAPAAHAPHPHVIHSGTQPLMHWA